MQTKRLIALLVGVVFALLLGAAAHSFGFDSPVLILPIFAAAGLVAWYVYRSAMKSPPPDGK